MLLLVYGTRPEWLKIRPLLKPLLEREISYQVFHTGQHDDLDSIVYNIRGRIPVRGEQESPAGRINEVLAGVILSVGEHLREHPEIDWVLVQGDTTTALGAALAAFHLERKIIHLEAGLRTLNRHVPFPEEINRQYISKIADIHFCPTSINESNLKFELEKDTAYIYIVGNTSLDNIKRYKDQVKPTRTEIVITLHRRENLKKLDQWLKEIKKLASKYKNRDLTFVFIKHHSHPIGKVEEILGGLDNVIVSPPLAHIDLMNRLLGCRLIITDSGGLQEECSFLGIRGIVCREITERPETIWDGFFEQVTTPQELLESFDKLVDDYILVEGYECPYGDGNTAERVAEILERHVK